MGRHTQRDHHGTAVVGEPGRLGRGGRHRRATGETTLPLIARVPPPPIAPLCGYLFAEDVERADAAQALRHSRRDPELLQRILRALRRL